jgi:hypothetical protein
MAAFKDVHMSIGVYNNSNIYSTEIDTVHPNEFGKRKRISEGDLQSLMWTVENKYRSGAKFYVNSMYAPHLPGSPISEDGMAYLREQGAVEANFMSKHPTVIYGNPKYYTFVHSRYGKVMEPAAFAILKVVP